MLLLQSIFLQNVGIAVDIRNLRLAVIVEQSCNYFNIAILLLLALDFQRAIRRLLLHFIHYDVAVGVIVVQVHDLRFSIVVVN